MKKSLLIIAIASFYSFELIAQIDGPLPSNMSPNNWLPKEGTFRALVIYCKFSDDNYDRSPVTNEWPSTLSSIPAWALNGTIAQTTGTYSYKSISDYYYKMSGGRLNIIGDVYPDLVIPQHESSYYYTSNGRNISYLTSEILNTIASDVDWRRYDNWNRTTDSAGSDGIIDFIFIMFREVPGGAVQNMDPDPEVSYQAYASLTGSYSYFCGEYPELVFDGKRILAGYGGSGCWQRGFFNQNIMLETAAHEMGHYYLGPKHKRGYGLMGSCGIMNSYEREQLGWINIQDISTYQFHLTIPSLINDGSAIRISRPNGIYYLEGRYSDNLYQTEWSNNNGLKSPGSGVLVFRVGFDNEYDVLFANNILYAAGRPSYATDYFNPGYNEILSYYSHPSTNENTGFGINFIAGPNGKIVSDIYIGPSILNASPSKAYNMQMQIYTGGGDWNPQLSWSAFVEQDVITGGFIEVERSIKDPRIYPVQWSSWSKITTLGGTATSYIDQGITTAGGGICQAKYRIRAKDSQNKYSLYSDEVQTNYDPYFLKEVRTQNTPREYSLHQNYPNPFNPSTTIKYQIPGDGYVVVKVYNILGGEVATLVHGYRTAGSYEVHFDASTLPSGIYVYRLTSGEYTEIRKMSLMK
jgi:M6 family metalloprotease-like protein